MAKNVMSNTVIEECEGRTTLYIKPGSSLGDKVVLYVHHTFDNKITKSVMAQLDEFNKLGWKIVLVDSSDKILNWPEYIHAVIHKPNVGSDFGGRALAMHMLPEIRSANKVFMPNSAFVGPFFSMEKMMKDFENSDADFYGITDSVEIDWHIQSYWFGFSNGVLAEEKMMEFWNSVKHIEDKSEFVIVYEIGFSKFIRENNWSFDVAFKFADVGPVIASDPGLHYWKNLLDMGRPIFRRRYVQWLGEEVVIEKVKEYGEDAVEMVRESFRETVSAI